MVINIKDIDKWERKNAKFFNPKVLKMDVKAGLNVFHIPDLIVF